MFIPSTFKRPVSSWKALNLRKTLLMASSVRLKPDRKSGSAGMPRPNSYAVFCLKKKTRRGIDLAHRLVEVRRAAEDDRLARDDRRFRRCIPGDQPRRQVAVAEVLGPRARNVRREV